MSIFFDMFVPSRRYVEEERNRLEWTRDEEGNGDPHRGPIDLDSGVVAIRVADEADESSATAEPAPGESAVTESTVAKSAFTKPAASQIRHTEP